MLPMTSLRVSCDVMRKDQRCGRRSGFTVVSEDVYYWTATYLFHPEDTHLNADLYNGKRLWLITRDLTRTQDTVQQATSQIMVDIFITY